MKFDHSEVPFKAIFTSNKAKVRYVYKITPNKKNQLAETAVHKSKR